MQKISNKTIKFLKNNVVNLGDFLPLNDDSQLALMQEIENQYVIPLANALADGEKIDIELLKVAEDVVDELNTDHLDIVDFNIRIKE